MIVEYHRPETLESALELLSRTEPRTLPLGGGTVLARQSRADESPLAVVDLQRLPLREIRLDGQLLRIGAAATLQDLYDCPHVPEALRAALVIEAGRNLRQVATVAGAVVSCTGRSPFVTALLALDARLVWAEQGQPAERGQPGEGQTSLGEYLALRAAPTPAAAARLMTEVHFPLNAALRFESVARAPLDLPVVCAAAAAWPSGRTRLALGGYGRAPIVALDGPEPGGAGMAARSAYLSAGDAWASAEYRAAAAAALAERLVSQLGERQA